MVILVAEDDVGVQFLIWKLLRGAGLTVLTARTGEAALQASRNHTGPIDLLLSDIEMPQMGGLELWRIISKERPGIKVLLISEEPQSKQHPSMSRLPFLQKPFTLTSLQDSIESLLGPISALQ
jgi:DNA-binding NtrC family response regulator